jgi:predicted HNH restriction endonuclease
VTGRSCQVCEKVERLWGERLHIHHMDHDHSNNSPGNLMVLCASCHMHLHRQPTRWMPLADYEKLAEGKRRRAMRVERGLPLFEGLRDEN